MDSLLTLLAMFVCLSLLLLTGMPLAFVLMTLAVFFTLMLWGSEALIITVLQITDTMTSDILLAIPLYILMAAILERSGIIEKLYRAMELWLARLPGGLAVGTIVICTLMAAMTGVVGAAVATMGILALPAMLSRQYDEKLSLGTICAGGTLGILIPPSIITIVYAATAQISVGKMFLGGVIPGLFLASGYILYIVIRVALNPKLAPNSNTESASLREKLLSLRSLILPILIVFSIIGSIYKGIATPTEAAAIGVISALLSAAIERNINLTMLKESAITTLKVTAMIMWITIGAKIFVSTFTALGGADALLHFIDGLALNRWFILVIMLLILVFLGLFLDEIGIILLSVPVFLPIIKSLGFDPLWFGILFLITAQTAYISPPFGYTLFYIKGVLPKGITMNTVYLSVLPFIAIQLAIILLFAFFPELITWLPSRMQNPPN